MLFAFMVILRIRQGGFKMVRFVKAASISLLFSPLLSAEMFSLKEIDSMMSKGQHKAIYDGKKLKVTWKSSGKNYDLSKLDWKPRSTRLANVYTKLYFSGQVNKRALKKAFKYYEKHDRKHNFADGYLAIADYTRPATQDRLQIIGLDTGRIYAYRVAHGKKSGPKGGRVYQASNRVGSHMTPKGFYKVGYKEGRTLKKRYKYLSVKGLDRSNRKVGVPSRFGGRDIVVHTARYVDKGGRSFGCFAIRPSDKTRIFSKLKGALLYSYTG
jgi:hypothetical protein